MKAMGMAAAMLLSCSWATPAPAQDAEPCGKDMVCASDPASVAAQMMRAGYQAMLSKDKEGDPMIDSAASGYKFAVLFYGCEANKACTSLQLHAWLTSGPPRDVTLANKWNEKKRFTQMAIDKDGDIRLTYDVTTIGGLTRKNFDDVVDWWASMLGEAGKFAEDNPPAVATKPAAAS